MKTKYKAPSVTPEVTVKDVTLDDFDVDEIQEYLDQKLKNESHKIENSEIQGNPDYLLFTGREVSRIETLVLCGQREYAIQEILEAFSKKIGKKI
jgi:hypothetical protein